MRRATTSALISVGSGAAASSHRHCSMSDYEWRGDVYARHEPLATSPSLALLLPAVVAPLRPQDESWNGKASCCCCDCCVGAYRDASRKECRPLDQLEHQQ